MCDLKVCRICLRTEAQVYKYDKHQLKYYYEEVMALKVFDNDNLPQYFCYECATMLHKFHKFKEKCYRGQKALKEILWRGPISYESVYKVDRAKYSLKSNLEVTHHTPYSLQPDVKPEVTTHNIKTEEAIGEMAYENDESSCSELNNSLESEGKGTNDESINLSSFKKVKNESGDEELGGVCKREKRKLEEKYWKKITLTEDEAMKEFRQRAEDSKYLAAEFKCTDCFRWFSKRDMLTRHVLRKHCESLGSHQCRVCRTRFSLPCFLRRHMRDHYHRYQCLRCDRVCPLENSAILHDQFHSGVVKKCQHCNEEFLLSSTYYTHLRSHRSEHVCTMCGASFVSQAGLRMHKKLKHVTDDIDSPDDDEEVNTHCGRCEIRFETRKAYEEHLFHSAMHTDTECDPGTIVVSVQSSASRKILGKREQAKITKGLRKKKADDTHTITIKRELKRTRRKTIKPTTCHQCGEHFATQAACLKHHLAEHPRTCFFPPAQRHICEICGVSLAPGSVAVHQNMHTREKVHTCDTCGKQFYASIGLKRHLVTHTGEKPFACTLCDKRFTQSNSMKLHYRTYHLKQPYPKRNRRKKNDTQENAGESTSEESDSVLEPELTCIVPTNGVQPVPTTDTPDDNMHYLTLT